MKLAARIGKQGKREIDSEYQTRIEAEATKLIKKVVATGEFYLVRAGNTRKGTGTFYTRPQLAVPTVHRTLEPLCYDKVEDGTLVPKEPEVILGTEEAVQKYYRSSEGGRGIEPARRPRPPLWRCAAAEAGEIVLTDQTGANRVMPGTRRSRRRCWRVGSSRDLA